MNHKHESPSSDLCLRAGETNTHHKANAQRRMFPDGSASKESACNAGDAGDGRLIPGLGRSPRGGNGNPLQDSCLKNPLDSGAWRATVQRVLKDRAKLSSISPLRLLFLSDESTISSLCNVHLCPNKM